MKKRLGIILRLLRSADDYITIEELARATGAGVRTVHRDLDSLGRSLSYRNIRLERRRGYGVRLLDQVPQSVETQIVASRSDAAESSDRRPLMMLLYLAIEGSWVKLSQLAIDFSISDSSVSTDLAVLEGMLPHSMKITRQKGVGVRLESGEPDRRVLILRLVPVFFPPHRIISMLGGEASRDNWMVRILDMEKAIAQVESAASLAQSSLDLRFSPRHGVLLQAYLLIARKYCRDGNPQLEAPKNYRLTISERYLSAANLALKSILPETHSPIDGEVDILARLLASLECTGAIFSDSRELLGDMYTSVKRAVETTLVTLEERYSLWLHDDHDLVDYVRLTVAAALHRLDLGEAQFDELIPSEQTSSSSPVAGILSNQICGEFHHVLPGIDEERCAAELEEAVLALEARMERRRSRSSAGLRVKILCYEGLGMANYIRITAEKILPLGTVIDSEWESDFGRKQVEDGGYAMVISSFPLENLSVPNVVIGMNLSQDEIAAAIHDAFQASQGSNTAKQFTTSQDSILSLSAIMNVLQNFTAVPLEITQPLIDQAVLALSSPSCNEAQLKEDFIRREEYGSLVFDEYGVRLLHCRSMGITRARASVLQGTDDELSVLVMAAPAGGDKAEAKVLSEIVIALSDDPYFPRLLRRGSSDDIRKALFRHFSRLMQG